MGLYLHIPFCKKACHYCNFHFSTSLQQKDAMLAAILHELELQQQYLNGAELGSVYLGGGTPSLLEIKDLVSLFEKIYALHRVSPTAEITLEANPDDLSAEKLSDLRAHTPVNRLSIGVQSFFEEDLRWMNRAHTAAESMNCLETALQMGFQDLTIDLIYGAPTTTDARWAENLRRAFDLGIPHLSCYALTVEEGTALAHFVKQKKVIPPTEETQAQQFEMLLEASAQAGYEQYEISNFALPGRYARHNTNYWRSIPYLGVGPSAHSFNGHSRQWNVANNARYIRSLEAGEIPFEREILSAEQRYNEYIMTALRTMWGVNLSAINQINPDFTPYFEHEVQPFLTKELLQQEGENYRLTRQGKLLADFIASELFLTPNP